MTSAIARTLVFCITCIAATVLTACIPEQTEPLSTIPTFDPKTGVRSAQTEPLVLKPTAPASQRMMAGPAPPAATSTVAGNIARPSLPRGGIGEALALEQVNLPQFINEVFAKTLKLNVQIDQSVMTRTDLVTLRTGKPLSGDELMAMAEKILAGYGIGISWDGEVLHVAANDALMAQMPSLIRSRSLPEISKALRPIFQIVDMDQVSANDMMSWLANAYGTKVKLFASPKTNSIMIFGLPENVAAAVEAARLLDQPRLAGRQSLRFSPIYWSAQALAAKLAEVLRAEGYDAAVSSSGSAAAAPAILIVPVDANNSLLAFAADGAVISHIRRWVSDLDVPGQVDPARNIFIYLVQNTTATSLGATVQNVLQGTQQTGTAGTIPGARLEQAGRTQPGAAAPPPTPPPTTAPGAQPGAPGAAQTGPRLVIDQARNALVFIGTAQDYEQVRPLLAAMDKAPREALIEVTVVELDLNDSTNLGVEFNLQGGLGSGLTQLLGTGTSSLPGGSAGLSLGTAGLNYTILNNVGVSRVVINALSQTNHLSVLSTPRVLAKSGGEAKIEVGTEVPIITSQGSTNTIQNAGTTGILQTIEYRKTGVLLTVKPVVHSGNRIDLDVTQEVSQALANTTPGISSPLIQNRNITTDVTLNDGQTVVIGGMIAEGRTNDDTGVPFLKDIPGIGLLFENQAATKTKTELLIFITPYVVSDEIDAERITDQFRGQLQQWPIPTGQLHP